MFTQNIISYTNEMVQKNIVMAFTARLLIAAYFVVEKHVFW